MAKRAKKSTKKARRTGKSVALAIGVKGLEQVEPVYCNYVEVRHTPIDFSLVFCHIAAAHEKDIPKLRKSGHIDAKAKAVIVLTPEIAASFHKALGANIEKYERASANR